MPGEVETPSVLESDEKSLARHVVSNRVTRAMRYVAMHGCCVSVKHLAECRTRT
jgi:hypothetical protein